MGIARRYGYSDYYTCDSLLASQAMAARRYVSWQYPVRESDEDRQAREDYEALVFDFNQRVSRIMRVRDRIRGRPGAARPPVYFDDFYNDPEGIIKLLDAYLLIEEWKEREGR